MEQINSTILTQIFQPCDSDAGENICPVCNQRTTMKIVLLDRPTVVRVMCQCQKEAYEERRRRDEFREKARKLERFKSYSLMDENFLSSTFENWRSVNPEDEKMLKLGRSYCEQWNKMKSQNKGILLYGNPGNGKSFLSFCIGNELYSKNVAVLAISSINIMNRIKDSFDKRGDDMGEVDIINAICDASLLILDDLGTEYKTPWTTEKLYSIIDTRYRSKKPLIITTNLNLNQLREHLTDKDGVTRTFDRIMEMCTQIEVTGSSRRVHKARDNFWELMQALTPTEDK